MPKRISDSFKRRTTDRYNFIATYLGFRALNLDRLNQEADFAIEGEYQTALVVALLIILGLVLYPRC